MRAIQIKNPEIFHSIMENRNDWFQEFINDPAHAHIVERVGELMINYIYTMAVTRGVLEATQRMEEVTA